jgi:dTDP-4-amino-4,6-dideoxygalactose transaminase
MNPKIKLVDLAKQYQAVKKSIDESIFSCIESSSFIGGKYVQEFERDFAALCCVDHAVGAANGTVALEIALKSAGVKQGDEVITVANTFFATAEAIINVGAVPVFVDVQEQTGLMDLEAVHTHISNRTRAIVPVHLFGHLVNIRNLQKQLQNSEIKIIEDAAQAHGARGEWGNPGSHSWAASFSFYPGKNLGAFGDAGAVVSNSEETISLIRKLIDHGRISKYVHEIVGTNARIDSLQAAILKAKLGALENWNLSRRKVALEYQNILSGSNFKILENQIFNESSWHLFPVRVSNRDEVMKFMSEENIETGIHYPVPLHRQPALKQNFHSLSLPVTEKLCSEIVSLPIHPFLENYEIERVMASFLKIARPHISSQ